MLITASTHACTLEPAALSPRVVRNFMVKVLLIGTVCYYTLKFQDLSESSTVT